MSLTSLGKPERDVVHVPDKLSYSSFSSFTECGERWRLERGFGVSTPTWWSTLAGTVLHHMTEIHDTSGDVPDDVECWFADLLGEELARHEERRGTEVKASGKRQDMVAWSGGPNKRDRDWWLLYGPRIFDLWVQFLGESPLEILVEGDEEDLTGVEVPFDLSTPGPDVRGFIDRVMYDAETDTTMVLDIKTGNLPQSNLQLATYGYALRRQYGLSPDWGGYWHVVQPRGKKEPEWRLTQVDLTLYTDDYIEALYARQGKALAEGLFLPSPSGLCFGCGVKDLCRAVGGKYSQSVPIDAPVEHVEAEVRV